MRDGLPGAPVEPNGGGSGPPAGDIRLGHRSDTILGFHFGANSFRMIAITLGREILLMLRALAPLAALAAFALTAPAFAVTIDFESNVNGEAGPFAYATSAANVSITSDTPPPGNHLGVAIFDSDSAGPNAGGGDPDLLVDRGNVLILQNNNFGTQSVGGIFDTPNDDEQGGQFFITFDAPVSMTSLDLVDINGGGMLSVILSDSLAGTRTYTVPNDWTGDITVIPPGWQTLDLTTLLPQVGIGGGGNATAADLGGFDIDDVVGIEINFSGSAAIDNITFVPEPTTALLVGLGLAAMAVRRRE